MALAAAILFLVQAQGAQASLSGAVRDSETGAAVEGVEVRLTDLGRSALTDGAGAYLLLDVPAGPQHLSLDRIGYEGRVRGNGGRRVRCPE